MSCAIRDQAVTELPIGQKSSLAFVAGVAGVLADAPAYGTEAPAYTSAHKTVNGSAWLRSLTHKSGIRSIHASGVEGIKGQFETIRSA